jgi:hypothetical protein
MTYWQDSRRRAAIPSDWQRTRSRIFQRDSYRCACVESEQRCTHTASEIDHIDNPKDHSDQNLRAICSHHFARRWSAQPTRSPAH